VAKKVLDQGTLEELRGLYTSVVIITIPKDEPVLVFKYWDQPFCGVTVYPHNGSKTWFEFSAYWRGQLYESRFPLIVKKHYGKDFYALTELQEKKRYHYNRYNSPFPPYSIPPYSLDEQRSKTKYDRKTFPDGVFELPIDFFLQKGDYRIDTKQVKSAIKALRSFGFLEDRRGIYKKKDPVKKFRDKFIIGLYRANKMKKRLPISSIRQKWGDELIRRYPSDPEAVEKWAVGESTIRRILKAVNKK